MSNLEILAVLENLRLRYPEHDHILRLASACVAACFGFRPRLVWTDELSRLGLVDYSDHGYAAEVNYHNLMQKADSLREAKAEATTYKFQEHNLVVEGEKTDLIHLAELLRDAEGTLGDLRYQIEYEFNVDGIRTEDQER